MSEPELHRERTRAKLIEHLRRTFVRRGSARGELRVILLATGLVGFGVSALMLQLGVMKMWVRYPLAALVGWLAFLVLVRLWAERERARILSPEELERIAREAGSTPLSTEESGRLSRDGRGWDWLDWFNPFDLVDDAEGCLVALLWVVVLVAFGGLIVALVGLIGGAEMLLAEVVLDAVLVTALYRRLRHLEARWWLSGAMRQTVKPVLIALLFLGALGFVLQQLAPDAHSIGGVWRDLRPPPAQR